MARVQFLAGAMMGVFLCHYIQTGSGAHSVSCVMGTGSSYPRGKVARA